MLFAWRILGAIALITLLLCIFVCFFDRPEHDDKDKKDDKHE